MKTKIKSLINGNIFSTGGDNNDISLVRRMDPVSRDKLHRDFWRQYKSIIYYLGISVRQDKRLLQSYRLRSEVRSIFWNKQKKIYEFTASHYCRVILTQVWVLGYNYLKDTSFYSKLSGSHRPTVFSELFSILSHPKYRAALHAKFPFLLIGGEENKPAAPAAAAPAADAWSSHIADQQT